MDTGEIQTKTYNDGRLRTTYTFHEQYLYVDIEGQFDAYATEEFDEWWVETLGTMSENNTKGVVFTFDRIAYLDSLGLRSILKIRNALIDRDCPWLVARASEEVMRLIEITQLDKDFPLGTSISQARPNENESAPLGRALDD